MKSILVKLGGSIITDASYRKAIIKQLVELKDNNYSVCVVHGGGKLISHYLGLLDIQSKFYEGLRITSDEALDVVLMVLAGKVNKDIVKEFNSLGVEAIGLCGGDAGFITCEKLTVESNIDLGKVGVPVFVNTKLFKDLTGLGYVLVIATIAIGSDGYYNVNADHTAAFVAQKVKVDHLIYVSDVNGVIDTVTNKHFDIIDKAKFCKLKEKKVITEGMIPKLSSCIDSLENGVSRVTILNGKTHNSILKTVMFGEQIGTEILINT